jgi:hypothetical protein
LNRRAGRPGCEAETSDCTRNVDCPGIRQTKLCPSLTVGFVVPLRDEFEFRHS